MAAPPPWRLQRLLQEPVSMPSDLQRRPVQPAPQFHDSQAPGTVTPRFGAIAIPAVRAGLMSKPRRAHNAGPRAIPAILRHGPESD
jgi:hypothetical protein